MAVSSSSAAFSLLLLLILSVSLSPSVNSASPDCSAVLVGMAPCLTYLQPGSTANKPDNSCCTSLTTVLKTAPACLCVALGDGGAQGVTINVTRATTLPDVCGVHAPPASACKTLPPTGSPGSDSAPGPSPSRANHGYSPIPIFGLITSALVILFARI